MLQKKIPQLQQGECQRAWGIKMSVETRGENVVDEASRISELSASVVYVLSHLTEISAEDKTILNGARDLVKEMRHKYWTNLRLIMFPIGMENLVCRLTDQVADSFTGACDADNIEKYMDQVLGASGNVFAWLTKPNRRGQPSNLECERVGEFFDTLHWQARVIFR
jgi:hypothetical protein